MISPFTPKLTPRDFSILETALATQSMRGDLLVAALRKKLNSAEIVFADDIPEDVVTIGSHVVFSVNDGWPCECLLVMPDQLVRGATCLTVASLRGLGMLGLSVGAWTEINCGSGRERLDVLQVLAQPEAASRARRAARQMRLVYSRDDQQPSAARRAPGPERPLGDDPGPSAA
jgi:regulator of nucleoside diphosphate kinase